jgi:AcrR family transcriptional regulator
MAPRQYRQKLRAEAAGETRRAILDTLYERIKSGPATPISVDEVAKLAGVARSTVYLIFGSRAGLFHALFDEVLRGKEYEELLKAVYHPDALQMLRGGIRATVSFTPVTPMCSASSMPWRSSTPRPIRSPPAARRRSGAVA